MNESPKLSAAELDSLGGRFEAICDGFEAAWKQGPARIEDFLAEASGVDRARLLAELLALEIVIRRQRGEKPNADEYLPRFPEAAPLIREQFQAAISADDGTQIKTGRAPHELTLGMDVDGADLRPGTRLGEYEILAKLGEGGMGAVYQARHVRLEKFVALKILPQQRTNAPQARARFEREMKAVGRVSHANIIEAMDARDIEGTTVLVMEYANGLDVAEVVRRCGPLAPADACEIVRQVAMGLQEIHEHGLVHRDIKPSNVMLTRRGQVKILDLGLALLHSPDEAEAPNNEMTSAGQIMGTVEYMAPEQAFDSHNVDIRADIYSLGCTLYRLLSGRTPFGGREYDSPMKKLMAHGSSPVPPLAPLRPGLPKRLIAVVERMLAKSREQRYATPADVTAAVSDFVRGCDLQKLLNTALERKDKAQGEPPSPTAPQASSAVCDTQPNGLKPGLVSMRGTADGVARRASRRVALTIAVALAFIALICLGVLFKLRTSEGTLVIEVSDPDAMVEVLDGQGKVIVQQKAGGEKLEIGVARGEGKLQVNYQGSQMVVKDFSLRAGGKAVIDARLEPAAWRPAPSTPSPEPPRALAPFDAAKAKEHQEAWAKYLGVPVEFTNSIGMKLVLIPPGEFDMGSSKTQIETLKALGGDNWRRDSIPAEGPRHHVRITRPFYFGVFHVTQEEYERVTGKNPSDFSSTGKSSGRIAGQDSKRFPVEMVSWNDAVQFCRKLSELPQEKQAGRDYRLPTEARWEYACRAGTTGWFSFSTVESESVLKFDESRLSEFGWFQANSSDMAHPVGLKPANNWGLYDMHGNVWQWCQDWHDDDYYSASPVDDPPGPREGSKHSGRGGGFNLIGSQCRSAARHWCMPDDRGNNLGFRVVLGLADEPNAPSQKPVAKSTGSPSLGSPRDNNEGINLLASILPQFDSLAGQWRFDGSDLVGENSETEPAALHVTYSFPDQYDLTMVVERFEGINCIAPEIVVGGRMVPINIDAWPERGYYSGIRLVDGKELVDREGAWHGALLQNGKAATFRCAVRRTGDDYWIRVLCDDREIVNWQGSLERLAPASPAGTPASKSMFLRMWTGKIRITKLELTPAGDELPLRPNDWVEVLSKADLNADALKGQWRREGSGVSTLADDASLLRLPIQLQGNYDVEVVFSVINGNHGPDLIVPVGVRPCSVSLFGWGGTIHGLSRIDGRESKDNPTAAQTAGLRNDRRYTLLAQVQVDRGRAGVDALLDGERVVHWSGKESSITPNSAFGYAAPPELYLAAWNGKTIFHSVRLRMISGKAWPSPEAKKQEPK